MQQPIPIESRALGTLAYIRSSIESASALAIPGMAGIVMGGIGMLAALAAAMPSGAHHWLEIWLVAAGIAFALGGAMMARETAQSGHARYLGPARKFLLCLVPALLTGATLTFVLYRDGVVDLIPGVWLLLYGCAVLSASTVTVPRTMRLLSVMGSLFLLLGLAALAAPPALHTLILGLGFGLLHSVFGVLIGRVNDGQQG